MAEHLYHPPRHYQKAREAKIITIVQAVPSTEFTITPASEATITFDNPLINVAGAGSASGQEYYFSRYTRRWQHESEAFGETVHYQRAFVVPFTARSRNQAAMAGDIQIATEAPTLSTVADDVYTITPGELTIQVNGGEPSLLQTNQADTVINYPQRIQFRTTHVHRPPPRMLANGIYGRRSDQVTYEMGEALHKRAVWIDYFASTEATIIPLTATIDVATEQAGFVGDLGAEPVTANITIETQSPQIFLDGVDPLSTEIAILAASNHRRRTRIRDYAETLKIEIPTRVIMVYAEANNTLVQKPAGVTVTIETEAPTIVPVNEQTHSPGSEATIAVLTDAPTITFQSDTQPVEATITVSTEIPTVTTGSQVAIEPVGLRIAIVTEVPGFSGIDTVVFPGGGGVETTEIAVITNIPTLQLTQWTDDSVAADNWTDESQSDDDWEPLPKAANDWNSN